MEGSSGEQQPPAGVFRSFESLFRELSDKLDSTLSQITTMLDQVRAEIATKASKEHVDAVEKRLALAHEQLERRVKDAEDDIVEIRVSEAGPRAVSRLQMAVFVLVIGGVFSIIASLIYVVATAGGHHP